MNGYNTDGSGLRRVIRPGHDDVDHFDACYLPDGNIVFGCTASYQSVPCWHGVPKKVTNLYLMDANGGNVRQLCFDQDHDLYPTEVTTSVGRYAANPWGLFDLHGNAAEWTRTTYRPYPYHEQDGRNDGFQPGRKVVRGGSWADRPHRCRSAFRLSYPAWQGVYNVGFRVVCELRVEE